jgi:hypothetical protein
VVTQTEGGFGLGREREGLGETEGGETEGGRKRERVI